MESKGESDPSAWEGFLLVHSRMLRLMERHLIEEAGLSSSEYDLLLKLARSGRRGLRMTELADRLLMSSGGFTRLVDRLQHRGLVERRRVPEDGRGLVASITPAGRATLRKASAVHLDDVHRYFLDRLTATDRRRLSSIWTGLEAVLDEAER